MTQLTIGEFAKQAIIGRVVTRKDNLFSYYSQGLPNVLFSHRGKKGYLVVPVTVYMIREIVTTRI